MSKIKCRIEVNEIATERKKNLEKNKYTTSYIYIQNANIWTHIVFGNRRVSIYTLQYVNFYIVPSHIQVANELKGNDVYQTPPHSK